MPRSLEVLLFCCVVVSVCPVMHVLFRFVAIINFTDFEALLFGSLEVEVIVVSVFPQLTKDKRSMYRDLGEQIRSLNSWMSE